MMEQLTNMGLDPLLLLAIAGLLVILIVVWVVRAAFRGSSRSESLLREQLNRMQDSQMQLQGSLTSLQEASSSGVSDLQRTMNERLENMSKRMGDSLLESREKTHESLNTLAERLAIIDVAQKNIEALGTEVTGLQNILANKQSRGAFGEMRMQDMVEDALPASAYSFQSTLSNGKRVDCLIHPPNGAEAIPVDAKFPLESWRALQEAPDQAARDIAARAMQQDIKKHVTDIAEKYILPGDTTDTALLFLPSEAIYADLHSHFRKVVEDAFKKRVMIVSPTTFMAALHTISSLIKDARMREQAHTIQKEVGMMMEDVRRLEERAKKLDNRFKLTEQAVDEIVKSTTGIARHASRIADVDVKMPAVETDVPEIKLAGGNTTTKEDG